MNGMNKENSDNKKTKIQLKKNNILFLIGSLLRSLFYILLNAGLCVCAPLLHFVKVLTF